jgi:hypothetical protein
MCLCLQWLKTLWNSNFFSLDDEDDVAQFERQAHVYANYIASDRLRAPSSPAAADPIATRARQRPPALPLGAVVPTDRRPSAPLSDSAPARTVMV